MTFYTTGEVDAQALALLLKERDDLMAAMQEREAEIGILNETLESRNRNIEALHEVSAAQRKVLEQALEALKAQPIETRVVWKDGIDLDVPVAHSKLCKAAITAIQEQLNEHN
jgi:hypothetical protein